MNKHRCTKSSVPLVVLLALIALPVLTGSGAMANEAPDVITVLMNPDDTTQGHPAWPGLTVKLKGTAHDPDGDTELSQYRWIYGDSTGDTGWQLIASPYSIEAYHMYACGSVGDKYNAVLEVCDVHGACNDDKYLVECVDPDETNELGAKLNRVNRAIDEGLWYMHKQMRRGTYSNGEPYGYIYAGGRSNSYTGSAVEVWEAHGSYPTPLGSRPNDPYVEDVERGLNYLLANLSVYTIGGAHDCPNDLNPEGSPNGKGLGRNYMYGDGIVLQALASSKVPDKIATTGNSTYVMGRTYREIAGDMADWLVYSQNYNGGWRYSANYGSSDNSVSQWPILGLHAAEAAPFNIPLSDCVKNELYGWLDYSQNGNGGYGYTYYGYWVNMNKTGAGMAGLALCDKPDDFIDWEKAEQYVCNYINNGWYGDGDWQNLYAWYGILKAVILQEENMSQVTSTDYSINCICPDAADADSCLPGHSGTGRNWYKKFSDKLIAVQNSNGSWSGHQWMGTDINTSWAIMILERTLSICHNPMADAGDDKINIAPEEEVLLEGDGSDPPAKYDPNDPDFKILEYKWDFDSADGDCGSWSCDDAPADAEDPWYDWHECHDCTVEDPCTSSATFVPPIYYIDDDPANDIDWDRTAKDYDVTLCITTENDVERGCRTEDMDNALVNVTPPPYAPSAILLPASADIGCEDCMILDASEAHHPAYELYCLDDPDHPYCDWIVTWEFDLDDDGAFDDGYCEDQDDPKNDQYDWCYWDTDGDGVMDRDGRHIEWCNCDFTGCDKTTTLVRLKVTDEKPSPDPNIDDFDIDDSIITAEGTPPECQGFVNAAGEQVSEYYCSDATYMEGVAEEACSGVETLEYQWDFDCDGVWDTGFSSDPSTTHDFEPCTADSWVCFRARVVEDTTLLCDQSIPLKVCKPPHAIGSVDSSADCDGDGTKPITLDGSASYDEHGRPVTCTWYLDGELVGNTCITTVPGVSLGVEHTARLEVQNDCDTPLSDSAEYNFTPTDTHAPTTNLPADQVAECEGNGVAWVNLVASCSDACGSTTCTNDLTGTGCDASADYPVGQTTVTFTCTDEAGNESSGSVLVTVEDTIPPTLECPTELDLIGAECLGYRAAPLDMVTADDTCQLDSLVADPDKIYCYTTEQVTFTATDIGSNTDSCELPITIECPGPSSQGYWHRQCLGVPEAEGGIDPGRNGRGPDSPTEPNFVEELMDCADLRLEDLGFYGTSTCEGMNAEPASDKCEKALKQLTALILNSCSVRVDETCTTAVEAEGCSSTTVAELIDEIASLIHGGDCDTANSCAAAINEGTGLPVGGGDSGGTGFDEPVEPGSDAGVTTPEIGSELDLIEEDSRPINRRVGRRNLKPTTSDAEVGGVQEPDRVEKGPSKRPEMDAAQLQDPLAALDKVETPKAKLKTIGVLFNTVGTEDHPVLVEELQAMLEQAREDGNKRLARKIERMIERIETSN